MMHHRVIALWVNHISTHNTLQPRKLKCKKVKDQHHVMWINGWMSGGWGGGLRREDKKGRKGGGTKLNLFLKKYQNLPYLMDRLQKDNPCLKVDMREKR